MYNIYVVWNKVPLSFGGLIFLSEQSALCLQRQVKQLFVCRSMFSFFFGIMPTPMHPILLSQVKKVVKCQALNIKMQPEFAKKPINILPCLDSTRPIQNMFSQFQLAVKQYRCNSEIPK